MKLKNAFRLAAVVAAIFAWLASSHAGPVTIQTVHVGDRGNANDSPANSNTTNGTGGVAYSYNIGKYDVTLTQYTAFLNAVAHSDPNSLYSNFMATDLNVAGISRSGTSGSYSYSVIGDVAASQRPISVGSMRPGFAIG